ncbi:neuralized-like protein 4 [Pomacea canaliculata]|uniref:neuralized-like protein 4 n=1 Tax=Pomacea canaliculata TaxID=400727 RepID=UPI000D732A5B|nr:neuralized-like protein 4 [Pomacea canaliculata]
MAQVDKTYDSLQKLVGDVCNKLKENTRTSHLQMRNSLRHVKTGLSNRLGKVTSHKHIVTRVTAVSTSPALIHMIQALTDRVNSLDLSTDLQGHVWVKPMSSVECYQEVVRRVEGDLLMLKQQKTDSELVAQPPVLVFHDNCGINIRLTNGNRTAEKIKLSTILDGGVVSRDPMLANVLYEVTVDAGTGRYNALFLGVTRISPACFTVTQWPIVVDDSVIVGPSLVSYQQKFVPTSLGEGLKKLKVGSRVGVLVTSSNDLHIYINGQDQGVVAMNVTQPWFAVFAIGSSYSKVTALPTSRNT